MIMVIAQIDSKKDKMLPNYATNTKVTRTLTSNQRESDTVTYKLEFFVK